MKILDILRIKINDEKTDSLKNNRNENCIVKTLHYL